MAVHPFLRPGMAATPAPRGRPGDARLLRLALWQATLPLLPLPLPLPPGRGRPRHPVQLALVCWPTLVLLLLECVGGWWWLLVPAGSGCGRELTTAEHAVAARADPARAASRALRWRGILRPLHFVLHDDALLCGAGQATGGSRGRRWGSAAAHSETPGPATALRRAVEGAGGCPRRHGPARR
jgi:hypothetical protein